MSVSIHKFLALHPNAQPCHGGGKVMIGESVWGKGWVRGGFSRRMADHFPVRRRLWKHIKTFSYSAEFDFGMLGWQEACRLAWEDAARRSA